MQSILSRPWVRALLGMAVSATFVVATVSRVDLDLLSDAWSRVALVGLLAAVGISIAELNARAARWRLLLGVLAPVRHPETLGLLAMGHLANAILPARLGDVARAVVTSSRLRISRAATLGTIAVERVSDAGLLGLAVAVAVLVGFRELAPTVAIIVAAGAAAGLVGVALWLVLRRERVAATRIGSFLRDHGGRFWAGATGLRGPREIGAWAALTGASFVLTVTIFVVVASAAGLSIPIWQAALVMAAATLSTAIPAGPASIGTYEFVGMGVLVTMGYAAEPALIAVGLLHAMVVVPPAIIGLAAMWWLGAGSEGRRVAHELASVPERSP